MSTDVSTGAARNGRGGRDVWTVMRLVRWSATYLEGKGVERGRLDAEHLLAHALGTARLDLYLQFDRPLAPAELDRYRPLLKRRAEREPLQYILGHAAFRELELAVDARVLIPRPETEVLVDEVLAWAGPADGKPRTALDVGTGSGAIALSLVAEGPFARVVATDTAAEALALARENARRCGASGSVEFREGPLFEPVAAGERFDVVVSNPPYVADRDAGALEPEVGRWEPAVALFAGPDGLGVLRGLVDGAPERLAPRGLLALEVGLHQAGPVVAMIEARGAYDEVRVRRDLAGRERVVLATRAPDTGA